MNGIDEKGEACRHHPCVLSHLNQKKNETRKGSRRPPSLSRFDPLKSSLEPPPHPPPHPLSPLPPPSPAPFRHRSPPPRSSSYTHEERHPPLALTSLSSAVAAASPSSPPAPYSPATAAPSAQKPTFCANSSWFCRFAGRQGTPTLLPVTCLCCRVGV